jgi:PAS domain S-box-containing protein
MLMAFTLPWETAILVLANISLPVLVIYPVITVLLGLLLANRERREKIQQVLKQTTTRLNAAQHLARMGGWEWNIAENSMFWTDEVYRIHGLSREGIPPGSTQYIQQSIACYDPADRPVVQAAFQNCIQTGQSYDLEFPFTTMQGKRIWIRTMAEAVSEEGQIVRVGGNVMDITERKQAEEALRESEQLYRQLFEMESDALFLIDKQTSSILDANRAASSLYGYSHDELLGMCAVDLSAQPDETRQATVNMATKVPIRYHRKKDGSLFPVEITATFLTYNGRQVHIPAIRDITERMRADAAAIESHARLLSILDANPEPTYVADPETYEMLYANQTLVKIHGALDQRKCYEYLQNRSTPCPFCTNSQILGTNYGKTFVWEYQNEVSQLWSRCLDRAITWPDGRIVRYEMAINITDRKQAEEKIKAAQVELKRLLAETERSRQALLSLVEDQRENDKHVKQLNAELEQRVQNRTTELTAVNHELEAFAYSVSHDLRAPLRALDGFSEILMSDYSSRLDDEGQRYLARIKGASRRMGQLIEDLLNLSRITRREINLTRVNLSLIAGEIANELQAELPGRRVEFTIAPDLLVRADNNLIKIALENLLRNAFKFTLKKEWAQIQFGMLEQNGVPVHFVRDNGVGFDMAFTSKLFTPFQRLHGAHEYPGTGIGLSIVQRIIARHGGRIWCEAVVNQGAAFYFTLGSE